MMIKNTGGGGEDLLLSIIDFGGSVIKDKFDNTFSLTYQYSFQSCVVNLFENTDVPDECVSFDFQNNLRADKNFLTKISIVPFFYPFLSKFLFCWKVTYLYFISQKW